MEIKGNCQNCKKPNLINRPAHKDIFCGWCGSEYSRGSEGKIYLVAGKNEHFIPRNRKQYDKQRYSCTQGQQYRKNHRRKFNKSVIIQPDKRIVG